MSRPSRRTRRRLELAFGPEWNPVLILLAVLAVLCVLAALKWYLGVIGLAAALIALGIAAGVLER